MCVDRYANIEFFFKNRACLVPRPHYSARPKRFGARGPIENVKMFPDRSPRIRHRNELTERDWENAVQGLGKNRARSIETVEDKWILTCTYSTRKIASQH